MAIETEHDVLVELRNLSRQLPEMEQTMRTLAASRGEAVSCLRELDLQPSRAEHYGRLALACLMGDDEAKGNAIVALNEHMKAESETDARSETMRYIILKESPDGDRNDTPALVVAYNFGKFADLTERGHRGTGVADLRDIAREDWEEITADIGNEDMEQPEGWESWATVAVIDDTNEEHLRLFFHQMGTAAQRYFGV